MDVSRFPLTWPAGRPRTHSREYGRFDYKRTRAAAFEALLDEVRKLGGSNPIVSSNLKLKNDGAPYSQQPRTDDPGVAIYFQYKGNSMCFACDRYQKDVDNIWALVKTIDCLRAIERYGSPSLMKQAFSGFAALPMPEAVEPWYVVLGVEQDAAIDAVRNAYRKMAKEKHPDAGGDPDEWLKIQLAYDYAVNTLLVAA